MVMGMREKLIEILSVPIYPHELADPIEAVADYLLDNDVVPVVRCKNCKFCDEQHPVGKPTPWYNCTKHTRKLTRPEHFCSYGERRTDD